MTDENLRDEFHYLLKCSPFAAWLGIRVLNIANGLETVLPFQEKNLGNIHIRSLHGGIISSAMECSAGLLASQLHNQTSLQKPASIFVSYLRSTKDTALNIQATPTKLGNRLSFFKVDAWQEKRDELVATAIITFRRPSEGIIE